MSRHKDVVTGGVVIALAILLFILSFNVQDFVASGVGAAFLPRIAAGLFAVLGGALVLEGWRQAKSTPEPVTPAAAPVEENRVFGGWGAVLLSAGLMCAYVALLDSIGFIVTSVVYIFLQILILSKGARQNFILFGLVALLIPVAAYFLFVQVFQVMIPAGILG